MRYTPMLLVVFCPACSMFSSSPATRNPLRDRLASADMSTIEDAARDCLTKEGWKVDPVGGLAEGANVVTAANAKGRTDVYIQGAEVKPRVTGGPDYADPFWNCLGGELASGYTPSPADSSQVPDDKPSPPDKP